MSRSAKRFYICICSVCVDGAEVFTFSIENGRVFKLPPQRWAKLRSGVLASIETEYPPCWLKHW
jgi:hypothetical protein